MLNAITTHLEIDVMQAMELEAAINMAQTHKMPAIIVHQDLVATAIVLRSIKRAQFKIITPIDWPRGDTYGMAKMTGLTHDALSSDGFEIMLTAKEHPNEIKAEAKAISSFIKQHLSPICEIRFVLGTTIRDIDVCIKMAEVMSSIPAPAMLRMDHHTKSQQTKASVEAHNRVLATIKAVTAVPLKASGNITSLRIAEAIEAPRLAVSVKQAEAIIQDIKRGVSQEPASIEN